MALVQPPVAPRRDPEPVEHGERQVGGADRPLLQRRVHDVGVDVVLAQQHAGVAGLGLALRREVDVVPPGEEVELVPLALAVPEQHEGRHGIGR